MLSPVLTGNHALKTLIQRLCSIILLLFTFSSAVASSLTATPGFNKITQVARLFINRPPGVLGVVSGRLPSASGHAPKESYYSQGCLELLTHLYEQQ